MTSKVRSQSDFSRAKLTSPAVSSKKQKKSARSSYSSDTLLHAFDWQGPQGTSDLTSGDTKSKHRKNKDGDIICDKVGSVIAYNYHDHARSVTFNRIDTPVVNHSYAEGTGKAKPPRQTISEQTGQEDNTWEEISNLDGINAPFHGSFHRTNIDNNSRNISHQQHMIKQSNDVSRNLSSATQLQFPLQHTNAFKQCTISTVAKSSIQRPLTSELREGTSESSKKSNKTQRRSAQNYTQRPVEYGEANHKENNRNSGNKISKCDVLSLECGSISVSLLSQPSTPAFQYFATRALQHLLKVQQWNPPSHLKGEHNWSVKMY